MTCAGVGPCRQGCCRLLEAQGDDLLKITVEECGLDVDLVTPDVQVVDERQ
jgi:hypothetical protein